MQINWEKIKWISWGVVGGAIVIAILGFNWGGWMTEGTANRLAQQKASEAVVERLAPICVAQFDQDPEKTQKLEELIATNTRQRRSYVEKQTWAIMPGETRPDRNVAQACADQIVQVGQTQ